jgi:HAD superfamily hydrolase (TIGR01509 family)
MLATNGGTEPGLSSMKFKAVIFDMDGVLVDSEPLHQKAWQQILDGFGISFGKEDYKRIIGKTTFEVMVEYFQKWGIDEDPHFWSEQKEEAYRAIIHEELKPLDGLIPLIEFLKEAGTKLAIASSAIRKNVEAVIECIQLQKIFQSVLSIEDVSSPKPHPEIYLKSAENLQVAPFECAVIEDSVPGLQAAKRSGAFVIGITTSFPAEVLIAADWIAHSFSEIKSFLETRLV